MRTSTLWRSILVPVAVLALNVSVAVAQKSPNPTISPGRTSIKGAGGIQVGAGTSKQDQQEMQQQIQQIGKQLEEGEKVLTDANEKASETRQLWQKADADHKQAIRELAQAKKSAEEEAKNSPELKAAKEMLESLRGELAEIRKQVIEKLTKENADYQKASKAHEDAVAKQKANSGAGVSPETRKELAKKVAEADKNKKVIEDVVMADNSEAKELTQRIKEATAELGAATKKKTDAIENDPKLSSAKVAFTRTRDDLKKAKSDLDQASGEANRIRSAMQTLSNQRATYQNQIATIQRQQQNGKGNATSGKPGK